MSKLVRILRLALREVPRSPTAAFYAMDGMYSGFAGLEIAPAFPAYTPSMAKSVNLSALGNGAHHYLHAAPCCGQSGSFLNGPFIQHTTLEGYKNSRTRVDLFDFIAIGENRGHGFGSAEKQIGAFLHYAVHSAQDVGL